MEREPQEPNGSNIKLQVSDNVPPGMYYLTYGEKTFYGSITDLGDNFISCGMVKDMIKKGEDINLIFNTQDWETNRDMIYRDDVK